MSNFYDSHRLATDEERAEKLGMPAEKVPMFPALNGYRLGEGGGRRFDQSPGSSGTNIVMKARDGIEDDAVIRKVRDGLYVGRVWYTYPINGQRAGDFTCTVSGDSYVIRNGRLAEPISAECAAHQFEYRKCVPRNDCGRKAIACRDRWGSSESFHVSRHRMPGWHYGRNGRGRAESNQGNLFAVLVGLFPVFDAVRSPALPHTILLSILILSHSVDLAVLVP